MPLFRGKDEAFARAPLVHHSGNGTFAIREGKWKLILGRGSGGRGKPGSKPGSRPFRLFDMVRDPGERRNLIEEFPREAADLEAKLEKMRESGRSR